jgi:hypothetical protein
MTILLRTGSRILTVLRRRLSVLGWLLAIRGRLSLVVVRTGALTVAIIVASSGVVLGRILRHVCFAVLRIPECCAVLCCVVLCCVDCATSTL